MTRTLALIPYVPNPPHGGGEQRLHHVLNAMSGATELVVYGLPRSIDQTDAWPLASRFAEPPHLFARGGVGPSSLRTSFEQPLQACPRRIQGDDSAELWAALDRLDLSGFSAVHVESLGMIPYGVALKARNPHLRLTLDIDNIDSVYSWQATRAARLWWLSRQAYWAARNTYRLFRFQQRWFPAFDAVWVCAESDRHWVWRWTRQRNVVLVPNGMDCGQFADVRPDLDSGRLVMAGTMMEGPNSDGVVWFVDRVWPRIRKALPMCEFWCVGRDPCAAVREAARRHPGVIVTGSVPDVRPHLAGSAVSVVPIRYGTGTRLKILEAMAAGLPVVSTRVGASGLDFIPGTELVLADRPTEFAAACVTLLTEPERRQVVASAGRAAVRKYDWQAIYRQIIELIRQTPQGTTSAVV